MNTRSFLTGCLLIAALFSTPSPASAQDDASIKQAVAAAESFLSLLDNGKYEESWDASAETKYIGCPQLFRCRAQRATVCGISRVYI